jgi:hypothetical protein
MARRRGAARCGRGRAPDPASLGPRMSGTTCTAGLWVTASVRRRAEAVYLYHPCRQRLDDGHEAGVVWQTALNPVTLELLSSGRLVRQRWPASTRRTVPRPRAPEAKDGNTAKPPRGSQTAPCQCEGRHVKILALELHRVAVPLVRPFETSFGRQMTPGADCCACERLSVTAGAECVAGTDPSIPSEVR